MNDLAIRTLSGAVLLTLAAAGLILGGAAFMALVLIVAMIAFSEWLGMARKLPGNVIVLGLLGAIYIGAAALALIWLRELSFHAALLPVVATVATDVGAYFAGRTIGGPRIAPAISPSKTWAGLAGGMASSALLVALVAQNFVPRGVTISTGVMLGWAAFGASLAVVAQAGDFLESYAKRRAGVKDSGAIMPGHGGLLDRIDGLLAVALVCAGLAMAAS